jgi:hypothetical protein
MCALDMREPPNEALALFLHRHQVLEMTEKRFHMLLPPRGRFALRRWVPLIQGIESIRVLA